MPAVRSTAAKLAIGVIAVSFLARLLNVDPYLELVPGLVIERFWAWQPVSYTLLAGDPFGVIFSALILWSIGGAMEQSWGQKRLLTFAFGGAVLAGVLTVLLAIPIQTMREIPYLGAWVMAHMIWIAYGLSIGRGQANFWGLPLSGNALALVGLGFILLRGAFAPRGIGFLVVVPDLIGAGIAFAYARGFSPRILWLRFQSWRLQNQLKGRSKHLRVISRERNTPSDSDRFLH